MICRSLGNQHCASCSHSDSPESSDQIKGGRGIPPGALPKTTALSQRSLRQDAKLHGPVPDVWCETVGGMPHANLVGIWIKDQDSMRWAVYPELDDRHRIFPS